MQNHYGTCSLKFLDERQDTTTVQNNELITASLWSQDTFLHWFTACLLLSVIIWIMIAWIYIIYMYIYVWTRNYPFKQASSWIYRYLPTQLTPSMWFTTTEYQVYFGLPLISQTTCWTFQATYVQSCQILSMSALDLAICKIQVSAAYCHALPTVANGGSTLLYGWSNLALLC